MSDIAINGSLSLHVLSEVDVRVDNIIQSLVTMDDAELESAFLSAQALGKAAWRLECAICMEIVDRDERREAKQAFVRSIADKLGASAGTVFRNAQICRTFGIDDDCASTPVLPDKTYYEVALRAPDPKAAIGMMADKKAANPRYNTSSARSDVDNLRIGMDVSEAEEIYWLKAALNPAERAALSTLAQRWSCDMVAAVKRCIHEQSVLNEW